MRHAQSTPPSAIDVYTKARSASGSAACPHVAGGTLSGNTATAATECVLKMGTPPWALVAAATRPTGPVRPGGAASRGVSAQLSAVRAGGRRTRESVRWRARASASIRSLISCVAGAAGPWGSRAGGPQG